MDAFDALLAEAIALKNSKGRKRKHTVPAGQGVTSRKETSAPTRPRYELAPGERAIALCTIIQRQRCRCCDNTTESIGGQYVVMQHPRLALTRHLGTSAAGLTLTNEEISTLPFRTDEVEREVAFCPSCIRLGLSLDYVLRHADAECWPVQLLLWRQ